MNQTVHPLHTKESAPPEARDALRAVEQQFGFIPNIFGQLAEAPAAAAGLLELMKALESSSLTPQEQWVVLLETAVQHTSAYCVAANSTVAGLMNVPAEIVAGVRSREALSDARFEALRALTAELVRERGRVSPEVRAQFLAAGFGSSQLLEVVLAVALETFAAYAAHTLETPLDPQFQSNAWSRPVAAGIA